MAQVLPSKGFSVVLVRHLQQHRNGGYHKAECRFWSDDREEARRHWERLTSPQHNPLSCDSDYRLLDGPGCIRLQKEIAEERSARRSRGQAKAKATQTKNRARGDRPSIILCPTCGFRTRKLFSEMGGLQTRQCGQGHRFKYDKWIADRAWANPAAMANVVRKI